jgi:hypothetical protein
MSLTEIDASVIYTGDLEPEFEATLSGRDPVDATAVPVRLIGRQGGAIVFDETITDKTVVGDTTVIKFQWTTAFTTPGPIVFEAEVMWPGNRPQTFPACNVFLVKRDADLP